jgi:broad specificity phosphatase PhoE
MKLKNKYYALRHGEAKSNVDNVISSWPEKFNNPLTKKGVAKIEKVAAGLKGKNIDLIFSSPLLRTKQTAEIVAEVLGVKVKFDKRLREIDFGTFNGKPVEDFVKYFKGTHNRIVNKTPRGENYSDISKRMYGFIKDINKKYKGKNILIVSHQCPILLLRAKIKDAGVLDSIKEMKEIFEEKKVTKGELIELN